jgi:hypothetical protein
VDDGFDEVACGIGGGDRFDVFLNIIFGVFMKQDTAIKLLKERKNKNSF